MRATTPSNAIISSIEFDVDGACFATAGVSKRIQIFDFRDVCGESSIWAALSIPCHLHRKYRV